MKTIDNKLSRQDVRTAESDKMRIALKNPIKTSFIRRRVQIFSLSLLLLLASGTHMYSLYAFYSENATLLTKDCRDEDYCLGVIQRARNKQVVQSEQEQVNRHRDRTISHQNKLEQPVGLENGIGCRYDGNCPMGMTCAARDKTNVKQSFDLLPGICQTIPVDLDDSRPSLSCVEACRKELELDEHFYHESWPRVLEEHKTLAAGRPAGCALYYKRDPDRKEFWKDLHAEDESVEPHGEVPSSIQKWDELRFRHIVRLEPVDSKNMTDELWMAYCTVPCRSDSDCQTSQGDMFPIGKHNPFLCQSGSCQRNAAFWERGGEKNSSQLVLVSAASQKYFKGLQNLISSAQFWAKGNKFVVYNIGLTAEQKDWIRNQTNVVSLEWPDGIPERYPKHVQSRTDYYAWKPLIHQETLLSYKMVLLLDAGSTLTGPIDFVVDVLKRTGIFLAKGQDESMEDRSHEGTYQWFNLTKYYNQYPTGPSFGGGTVGHLYPSRYYDPVVSLGAKCALDVECIAPRGSSRQDHRYDQTALSLCAYQPKVRAPHYTEHLAAEKWQLPGFPFKPNYRFVWTSRRTSSDYLAIAEGRYLPKREDGKSAKQSRGLSMVRRS